MRRFSRRLSLVALLALALGGAARSARADAPAESLVRMLSSSARPHPLADAKGRVAVTAALPLGVHAAALGLLPIAPGFGGVRLEPAEVGPFAAAHPELSLRAAPPLHALLDHSRIWTNVDAFRKATGADGTGVVVGIIDTGIDITHPDFRDAKGKTRIQWLLHSAAPRQTCHAATPGSAATCLEDEFGCAAPNQTSCAIYDASELDAMLSKKVVDEALRDAEGHGTHVASIAGGNGGPMAGKPKYVGLAPNATLVIVDPSLPGLGFSDADVLNAARFVFDRAAALGMPCVVNLSIGGDFGPHDGTSAIEAGLAAMVGDDKPGRAIVVAAGNSGALYKDPTSETSGPFGVHTEAHVSPSAVTRVPLHPVGAKGQIYVWATFRLGDQVSVGLEGPGGASWIGLTAPGAEAGYDGSGVTGAVINSVVDDKSSLTADTRSAVIAVDGAWVKDSEFAVLLEGTGDAELWVAGQGDAQGTLFDKALRQGTINVPASHPSLIAVGCSVNRIAWKPLVGPALELGSFGVDSPPHEDSLCYFSSAGPTPFGVGKPEIVAPGAFVAAAMSVDADPRVLKGGLFDGSGCPTSSSCYVVDDRHAIAVGTSMSAPHVAGAVALLLQEKPTLTQAQISQILQTGARHPKGPALHDPQLGVGELDLEGARQAMVDEIANGAPPDPGKSWYALSSEYARPDPTWPVWGTIELRRADGTVASGLDGTHLSVRVDGGVTYRPLTKVRHGMWRFAFAGPSGAGGRSLTVAVDYDGVQIGALRRLPIGADAWQARSFPEAVGGGCALVPARDGSGGGRAIVALAFGVALARRRRTRRR